MKPFIEHICNLLYYMDIFPDTETQRQDLPFNLFITPFLVFR